jgi:hypothetical protein
MTSAVTTKEIYIGLHVPIYLRLAGKGTGVFLMSTKPGHYLVEERTLYDLPAAYHTHYVKEYPTVRNTRNGIEYDGWHVWPSDLSK